jgi:hypothetical protein
MNLRYAAQRKQCRKLLFSRNHKIKLLFSRNHIHKETCHFHPNLFPKQTLPTCLLIMMLPALWVLLSWNLEFTKNTVYYIPYINIILLWIPRVKLFFYFSVFFFKKKHLVFGVFQFLFFIFTLGYFIKIFYIFNLILKLKFVIYFFSIYFLLYKRLIFFFVSSIELIY